MKRSATIIVLAGLLVFGSAWGRGANVTDPDLPRSLPADGPVSVSWTDPARFTEITHSRNRYESMRGDWVRELAQYLRKDAAKELPQGARMEVTITDIDLAGDYEIGSGGGFDAVRRMREIFPPRIDLTFKLMATDGRVLSEGTRELIDQFYLRHVSVLSNTDRLHYEKRLIDQWGRQEFKAADL